MKFGISITPAQEQIEFEREHLLKKLKEADKYLKSADHNLNEKRGLRAQKWYLKAREIYVLVSLAIEDGSARYKDLHDRAKNALSKLDANLEKAEELPLFF
ncbi:hypothetical protein J4402_02745 [Candidatus Pacearchaeota archaeon]|nr:hypothetical protein [Candidatus Pacearchaeota archaeon]